MRVPVYSIILLLLVGAKINGIAQDITGSLEQHVDSIIDSLPGSIGDHYVEPTVTQRLSWEGMVGAILQGGYASAKLIADSLNYQIIDFLDLPSSQNFHILEEKMPQQYYWGTYVFNPNPCRTKLVIQAPHPKKDFNTGKQGIFIHMEQEKTKLRADSTGWYKVYKALASSFPCDSFVTVGIVDPVNHGIRVFPVPVASELTIQGKEIESVRIYNHLGILCWTSDQNTGSLTINFDGYPPGVYLIKLGAYGDSIVRKIIKI
ncbi:MAG: T9SS type A sorting domain-containing protein [Flavobacteriales bacterium]|nr:T9SS type A sorting domain-containing protein [Flavobacteriales bacterium]